MSLTSVQGKSDDGSVFFRLPLLFAEGLPTRLEKMTIEQLEKFVSFLIQCLYKNKTYRGRKPEWWPKDLLFSFPLQKNCRTDSKWLQILRKLVVNCYTDNNCEFLLRFSSILSKFNPAHLVAVEGKDNHVSYYNTKMKKLIVMVRKENVVYDKKKQKVRKKLLLKNNMDCESLNDSYLPPFSAGEFVKLNGVNGSVDEQNHQIQASACDPFDLPNQTFEEDISTNQNKFLGYLELYNSSEGESRLSAGTQNCVKGIGTIFRYFGIPISSPLGQVVMQKSQASDTYLEAHLERLERYCSAGPGDKAIIEFREPQEDWPVTWKNRKRNGGGCVETDIQKKMLTSGSVFEMLKLCQSVRVTLTRLTPQDIKLCTSGGVGLAMYLKNRCSGSRKHSKMGKLHHASSGKFPNNDPTATGDESIPLKQAKVVLEKLSRDDLIRFITPEKPVSPVPDDMFSFIIDKSCVNCLRFTIRRTGSDCHSVVQCCQVTHKTEWRTNSTQTSPIDYGDGRKAGERSNGEGDSCCKVMQKTEWQTSTTQTSPISGGDNLQEKCCCSGDSNCVVETGCDRHQHVTVSHMTSRNTDLVERTTEAMQNQSNCCELGRNCFLSSVMNSSPPCLLGDDMNKIAHDLINLSESAVRETSNSNMTTLHCQHLGDKTGNHEIVNALSSSNDIGNTRSSTNTAVEAQRSLRSSSSGSSRHVTYDDSVPSTSSLEIVTRVKECLQPLSEEASHSDEDVSICGARILRKRKRCSYVDPPETFGKRMKISIGRDTSIDNRRTPIVTRSSPKSMPSINFRDETAVVATVDETNPSVSHKEDLCLNNDELSLIHEKSLQEARIHRTVFNSPLSITEVMNANAAVSTDINYEEKNVKSQHCRIETSRGGERSTENATVVQKECLMWSLDGETSIEIASTFGQYKSNIVRERDVSVDEGNDEISSEALSVGAHTPRAVSPVLGRRRSPRWAQRNTPLFRSRDVPEMLSQATVGTRSTFDRFQSVESKRRSLRLVQRSGSVDSVLPLENPEMPCQAIATVVDTGDTGSNGVSFPDTESNTKSSRKRYHSEDHPKKSSGSYEAVSISNSDSDNSTFPIFKLRRSVRSSGRSCDRDGGASQQDELKQAADYNSESFTTETEDICLEERIKRISTKDVHNGVSFSSGQVMTITKGSCTISKTTKIFHSKKKELLQKNKNTSAKSLNLFTRSEESKDQEKAAEKEGTISTRTRSRQLEKSSVDTESSSDVLGCAFLHSCWVNSSVSTSQEEFVLTSDDNIFVDTKSSEPSIPRSPNRKRQKQSVSPSTPTDPSRSTSQTQHGIFVAKTKHSPSRALINKGTPVSQVLNGNEFSEIKRPWSSDKDTSNGNSHNRYDLSAKLAMPLRTGIPVQDNEQPTSDSTFGRNPSSKVLNPQPQCKIVLEKIPETSPKSVPPIRLLTGNARNFKQDNVSSLDTVICISDSEENAKHSEHDTSVSPSKTVPPLKLFLRKGENGISVAKTKHSPTRAPINKVSDGSVLSKAPLRRSRRMCQDQVIQENSGCSPLQGSKSPSLRCLVYNEEQRAPSTRKSRNRRSGSVSGGQEEVLENYSSVLVEGGNLSSSFQEDNSSQTTMSLKLRVTRSRRNESNGVWEDNQQHASNFFVQTRNSCAHSSPIRAEITDRTGTPSKKNRRSKRREGRVLDVPSEDSDDYENVVLGERKVKKMMLNTSETALDGEWVVSKGPLVNGYRNGTLTENSPQVSLLQMTLKNKKHENATSKQPLKELHIDCGNSEDEVTMNFVGPLSSLTMASSASGRSDCTATKTRELRRRNPLRYSTLANAVSGNIGMTLRTRNSLPSVGGMQRWQGSPALSFDSQSSNMSSESGDSANIGRALRRRSTPSNTGGVQRSRISPSQSVVANASVKSAGSENFQVGVRRKTNHVKRPPPSPTRSCNSQPPEQSSVKVVNRDFGMATRGRQNADARGTQNLRTRSLRSTESQSPVPSSTKALSETSKRRDSPSSSRDAHRQPVNPFYNSQSSSAAVNANVGIPSKSRSTLLSDDKQYGGSSQCGGPNRTSLQSDTFFETAANGDGDTNARRDSRRSSPSLGALQKLRDFRRMQAATAYSNSVSGNNVMNSNPVSSFNDEQRQSRSHMSRRSQAQATNLSIGTDWGYRNGTTRAENAVTSQYLPHNHINPSCASLPQTVTSCPGGNFDMNFGVQSSCVSREQEHRLLRSGRILPETITAAVSFNGESLGTNIMAQNFDSNAMTQNLGTNPSAENMFPAACIGNDQAYFNSPNSRNLQYNSDLYMNPGGGIVDTASGAEDLFPFPEFSNEQQLPHAHNLRSCMHDTTSPYVGALGENYNETYGGDNIYASPCFDGDPGLDMCIPHTPSTGIEDSPQLLASHTSPESDTFGTFGASNCSPPLIINGGHVSSEHVNALSYLLEAYLSSSSIENM